MGMRVWGVGLREHGREVSFRGRGKRARVEGANARVVRGVVMAMVRGDKGKGDDQGKVKGDELG